MSPKEEYMNNLELSKREQEIIDFLALGLCNKDIAKKCEISEKTVEKHLMNIYRKIGVQSRTEAILWYIKQKG
jgi:DNA-binding NarL/FixJ family response regulator